MDTPTTNKERSQSISILIFSVLIMVIMAVLITQDMNYIRTFIEKAGSWGIVISIAVYAMLGLTLIPSEPLTLFIGALFGPYIALLIAGCGNTLSALVEYFLGKRLGVATNFLERKEKLPWGLGKLRVDSPLFLIGARMVPGIGPKLVSVTAGVYHVPLFRYFWTSAVSVFMGAALFAFGGSGLGSLFTKS